jgi:hypothetical protein
VKLFETSFRGTELCLLPDNYEPPFSQLIGGFSVSGKKLSPRRYTVYPYSNKKRVLRVDSYNGRKNVYLQQLDPLSGEWVLSEMDNTIFDWPVYSYLRGSLKIKGDTVLAVEGEKTCEFVKQETGIYTITFSSVTFSSIEGLAYSLRQFISDFPHIKNLIYCPDLDEPGEHKALLLQKACNILSVGYKKFSIPEDILPKMEYTKGYDLADLSPSTLRDKFMPVLFQSMTRKL